ncbi:hypothetical protein BaRGS_00001266 [Batillaria attramentaria]|uniref:Bis(5'-nucleosyl)-tetraphosphatase [asymmetrical] n=1 Tax=Batillaria attramentaria TaxID=370345 RepID=A0ABD0M7L4_9CAEN
MAAVKEVVAAGFIIFRRCSRPVEYLVMKHKYGGHWGTPKGHVDPGESEFDTALRETLEEAGLTRDKLKIFDAFKTVLHYEAFGKPKRVVFWLSELVDPQAEIILSDEHTDFKWLPLDEACRLLQFEDMQKAVRDADKFISTSLR